jgi:uncharacterized membrane protein YczE
MFLLGIVMKVGNRIYIGVDAGRVRRDSLMLAVASHNGQSSACAAIGVVVVLIGWLLGGPAGIGTVVFALLIGPSVQWA